MTRIFQADSINAPATTRTPIPQAILHAAAVAGYNGGNSWPTFPIYEAARPDLVKLGRVISIALSPFHRTRCLDIESGGATNAQAAWWFHNMADRSQGLPIFYTFASNVQALINTLSAAGIARDQYFIWSAHFNYVPHICGPGECQYPRADGTQYSNHIPENCDGSLMNTYIYLPSAPPLPPLPTGVDPMSVAIVAKPDGNLVAVCEAQPVGPGKTGEVFQIWTTSPGMPDTSGPVWHGEAGVTPHRWVSLGTPTA